MARLFDDASSQYLSCASPVSDLPVSMACWIYCDDMAAKQYTIQLRNSSNDHWVALQARFELGSDPIQAQLWNGTAGTAQNFNQITVNTWHFIGASFTDTWRRAYANDTVVPNGGSLKDITPPLNQLGIGAKAIGGDYTSGRIAEIAMWNVELSSTEMYLMSYGYSPLHIRPASLVFYLPAIRDNDKDLVGGLTLTPTNGPTVAAHPPIIYPGMQTMMGSGSGSASTSDKFGPKIQVV